MLIEFAVENWMCFKERATLSMVASRERQHGDRIPSIGKYHLKILPTAAIYGANASGKTALFKAIAFARGLIINGTKPDEMLGVEPFRLSGGIVDAVTSFCFQVLSGEIIYELSFSLNQTEILEERLAELTPGGEKELYHRHADTCEINPSLPDLPFLNFAFRGTRSNQLFLTNAISQKVETFNVVYRWFENTLQLMAPDSHFRGVDQLFNEETSLSVYMNRMLPQLDVGIQRIAGEEVSFESLPIARDLKNTIAARLRIGESISLDSSIEDGPFVITKESRDVVRARKLVAFHSQPEGNESKFDFRQESDGTRRLIDLLPAFLEISSFQNESVFVIDEIDRSLHTLLTRQLLEHYLEHCTPGSRTQLLFTTHDVMLMDQELLRRDEMWVTEKDKEGESTLCSFSEYKDVRYDKDIMKSYLQGRMGGVPRFLMATGAPGGGKDKAKR